MSEDIVCDDHVGEAYPPRCAACDLERQVAEATVPDFAPRVVSRADVEAEGAALAELWRQVHHPADVVATVCAVLDRSDPLWTALVAVSAIQHFSLWVAFSCPAREQHLRARMYFPVLRMLKQFAQADPQIADIATNLRSPN